ncbi:hypothetical protein BHAP_0979 [Bifidobacterium hapali]|uniref:Uncharacterized protein n=1 Tax=Bifidobacterium hapali TaxID=1630172 RepID=A0A261FZG8_9BIFI|nr:hypothetical protein BHAP_0979 [Bifidobacterium hapali]
MRTMLVFAAPLVSVAVPGEVFLSVAPLVRTAPLSKQQSCL